MRSSTYCSLLSASALAMLPMLFATPARAQIFTRPNHPLSVYLNVPVEAALSLWADSTDQDTSPNCDAADVEQSIGYSLEYDLFRTIGRRRPALVSAFYDNFSIVDSFTTTYSQANGSSNTFPGGEHLRAQGIGLEARLYVAGHDPAAGLEKSSGVFLSAAEGYYRVTGSRNSVGQSYGPMSQWGAETVLAPKFSLGYEGLGRVDVQLSYCLFNNLGISNFTQNQPLVIQAGLRF